jgi:hypothetical protein
MNEEKIAEIAALNRSTDALEARRLESIQVTVTRNCGNMKICPFMLGNMSQGRF